MDLPPYSIAPGPVLAVLAFVNIAFAHACGTTQNTTNHNPF